MEFRYEIKIPKIRIAVLIGRKGTVKKRLEEETNTKIIVDSKEGEVFVKGKDAVSLYNTNQMITAIGRGFNPEIAELLLKNDYCFELISLNSYTKERKDLLRIKGRLIGTKGKCRKTIEQLTDCHISIYGKTIGIIGLIENVNIARRAIEQLLKGSPHSHVYKWLEKKRGEIKI